MTEDQELSDAIKARASYHQAPVALRTELNEQLRAAQARSAPLPGRVAAARGPSGFSPWGWLSAGAAFVFGLVLAFGIVLGLGPGQPPGSGWFAAKNSGGAELTNEIVASHVRSLMASHLADVASTDQHTVKPWFNGKTDFSPPVTDFAAQGYPLTGGRLDYLDRHTVAALVYRRNAHPINLFVWPEGGADESTQTASEQGYHVFQWRQGGMRYAAVSDVNADELKAFVDLVKHQFAG